MKKNIAILLTCYLTISIIPSFAQEIKKPEKVETKMDVFSSKTGVITKFLDFKLSGIKSSFAGLSETRIRKVMNGPSSMYFFQIEKPGKYSSSTASIEYSDLLEVIKAFSTLKSGVEKDVADNPDYLENKFTTVDGFQIGYYVSKGKASWYLRLEKYGSENTLFIDDISVLDNAFAEAKAKIEEKKS